MLKIILVDDEEISLKCITETINWNELGFEIVGTAKDGAAAFELYKKHLPDIIITDISMPRISGLDLVKKIREISDTAQFIILTAYPVFEYAQEAINYTVSSYLTKPFKNSDLIEALNNIKKKLAKETDAAVSVNSQTPALSEGEIENLLEAMYNRDENKAYGIINDYFDSCCKLPSASLEIVRDSIGQAITILVREFIGSNTLAYDIFGKELKPFLDLQSYTSLAEIQEYVTQILNTTFNSPYIYPYINASPLVRNAITYIMENYREKISTATAAKVLFISSEHLMRSFKSETGYTFSEYLTNYRITAAKRLLKSNKYKIYEVCNMVGYSNIIYFNKIFKKVTGHNPSYYSK